VPSKLTISNHKKFTLKSTLRDRSHTEAASKESKSNLIKGSPGQPKL